MARVIKTKKKKKLTLPKFTVVFFTVSVLAYLGAALFLRSYNNSLSSEKQKIEAQISALQVENDAVAVEVNTLNNRERVNTMAGDSGLRLDQDNIYTITRTDEGD